MTDYLATAVIGLVGLVILIVASVILTIRSKADRAIQWSGFGVTFSVTPCINCKRKE